MSVGEIRARYAMGRITRYDFEHIAERDFSDGPVGVPLLELVPDASTAVRLQWTRECIRAIYALHHCGLLHRCISPTSFRLVDKVYLWDIEHCVCISPSNAHTRGPPVEHQVLCGAPELKAPRCKYGFEVDVWCLGRLLYYIMTLEQPPDTLDDDMWTPWVMHSEWQLYAIVIRAMIATDPRDRPTMYCTRRVLDITATELAKQSIDTYTRMLYDNTEKCLGQYSKVTASSGTSIRKLILVYQANYMSGRIDPTNVRESIWTLAEDELCKQPRFWSRANTAATIVGRVNTKKITMSMIAAACAISEVIHNDTFEGNIDHVRPYMIYI